MLDPASGAPSDYDELFRSYREFAVRISLSVGVRPEDVDDVVQDIMLRFMERGDLEKYDPQMRFEVHPRGKPLEVTIRTAKFKTYFGRFVYLSSLSCRDKISRRNAREKLLVDHETAEGARWADSEICADPSHEEWIVQVAACVDVLGRVEDFPTDPASRRRWTLAEGLAACWESVTLFGKIDRGWVADRLGVGRSTVGSLISELRRVLEVCGSAEALDTDRRSA